MLQAEKKEEKGPEPRPIVTVAHSEGPLLLLKSEPVRTADEAKWVLGELQRTIQTMSALGLAAPQIGINKQAFLVTDTDNNVVIEAVNPSYEIDGPLGRTLEGCFSIPGRMFRVPARAIRISAKWQEVGDDGLVDVSGPLYGRPAIVFQHEFDHLGGVLILKGDEVLPPEGYRRGVGRNEPCFCGSGAKYKKCHEPDVRRYEIERYGPVKPDCGWTPMEA